MPRRVDTPLRLAGARDGYLNLRNFRNRQWKPAVRSMGLESQTVYSMRHSYASWSIAAGESLFALARFMGTSAKMIDQTYGHLAEDAEAQNLSLLNSWGRRIVGAPANQGPRCNALLPATMLPPGRLAQLGEHQLDKLGVTGSSPVPPTSRKPRAPGLFRF